MFSYISRIRKVISRESVKICQPSLHAQDLKGFPMLGQIPQYVNKMHHFCSNLSSNLDRVDKDCNDGLRLLLLFPIQYFYFLPHGSFFFDSLDQDSIYIRLLLPMQGALKFKLENAVGLASQHIGKTLEDSSNNLCVLNSSLQKWYYCGVRSDSDLTIGTRFRDRILTTGPYLSYLNQDHFH